jgi:hypothetical protein
MPTTPVLHKKTLLSRIATLVTAGDRALASLAVMSQPEAARLGIVGAE